MGARRRAILMAALECFNTRGVSSTTIAEIRGKCGASTGSIYHHFESKEDIAVALYVEGLREYQQGMMQHLRRQRIAEAGIKALVGYHLRWVRERQGWARYLLQMREAEFLSAAEGAIRELNRAFGTDVGDSLEPHVKAGVIARPPDPILFSVLLGPAQLFARLWLAGRTRLPPEAARPVLAEAAWKALRVAEQRAPRKPERRGRRP